MLNMLTTLQQIELVYKLSQLQETDVLVVGYIQNLNVEVGIVKDAHSLNPEL
jgi:hypothetical protein